MVPSAKFLIEPIFSSMVANDRPNALISNNAKQGNTSSSSHFGQPMLTEVIVSAPF